MLDGAEHGETVVVTRGGRPVATIVPAPRANGRAVTDVLARWSGRLGIDDEFAAHVAAAGEATTEPNGDPWRERSSIPEC